MSDEIPFELELWGGAAESRYRAWRPEIEALPWADLSGLGSEAERVAARRAWTAASLQEYATAQSHAVLLSLLVAARAPLDLSALASRFPLDELAHAELCARMANALGGGAPVTYRPAQLFAPPAPAGDDLARLAERVVRDCCVSEMLATALLRLLGRGPGHPLVRQVHQVIARDEAIHGHFGWLFLDWASERLDAPLRARLASAAAEEVARHREAWAGFLALPPVEFAPFGLFAGVAPADYQACGEEALARRVLPRLRERGLAP